MGEDATIETMDSLKDYLPKLINNIENRLEEIRSYSFKDKKYYLDLYEGFEWSMNAIELTKENHKLIIDSDIKDTFNVFSEAFINEDLIWLADIIEYEIYPRIKKWEEYLIKK